MTFNGFLQIAIYLIVLVLLAKPLGGYMARVYQGEHTLLTRVLGPIERLSYRILGVKPEQEMAWKTYTVAVLLFSVFGFLFLYILQRLQGFLPLNPQGFGAVSPDSSLNTATSFVTNTNWQGYGGETTMSYLTQMLGMTVQNFASAATGMAVLIAFIRGFMRHSASTIGNFWVDLTRSVLYILLPLALVLALILVAQGVVQSFSPYVSANLVQPTMDAGGAQVTQQVLATGPAASQIAIKQLGTNGGGFFNVNSAHPFENPTPLANFLEMLSILLIPAALCYTFGKMVNDTRQGWVLLTAMLIILVVFGAVAYAAEGTGNPRFTALGVNQTATNLLPGSRSSSLIQTVTSSPSLMTSVTLRTRLVDISEMCSRPSRPTPISTNAPYSETLLIVPPVSMPTVRTLTILALGRTLTFCFPLPLVGWAGAAEATSSGAVWLSSVSTAGLDSTDVTLFLLQKSITDQ